MFAVLLAQGRYVLQLRDQKPGIADPGVWALFGGKIESGETPRAALIREIQEELAIPLANERLLAKVERESDRGGPRPPYWVFEADITRFWGKHQLAEGQAANSFAFRDLESLVMPAFAREILEEHHSRILLR